MAERADGSLSVAGEQVPLVSVLGAKRGSWTAGCALNCMAILEVSSRFVKNDRDVVMYIT